MNTVKVGTMSRKLLYSEGKVPVNTYWPAFVSSKVGVLVHSTGMSFIVLSPMEAVTVVGRVIGSPRYA